jgi:alkyldihydroxyacetonephosphate synthase
MRWDGWGDPALAQPLSDNIKALLKNALGVSADDVDAPTRDEVRLRPSALSAADRDALAAVAELSTDDADRLLHAGGKSTLDLLRRKSRDEQDAPDAIITPADEAQITAVLRICSERGIAVVPFGGGTSVVGGVAPIRAERATIALDLRRFDAFELDETSREATLGAGLSGPRAEELLSHKGFELGHYPQSFRFATIGGFAATRSSGQDSAGYGRFDEMVTGLRVVTPAGVLDLGRAPASAAGPDLRQLFLGSEGTLGVITAVRVRVHPAPEAKAYEAWTFPDFATGAAALRAVTQQGSGATVIRLSDEAETGVNLAVTDRIGAAPPAGGCLAITVFEGTAAQVQARRDVTRAVLDSAGGTSLGPDAAQAWEHGRFDAPYLRDALLANGALCETLETATSWTNLEPLKAAVTDALQAALGTSLVMCHVSHVYPTGASLYFTVVAALGDDPIARWQTAKRAAGDAIMANGGTITHHHAVGTDHRPWLTEEVGELGVQILRAVKATVDPAGILNPDKLIP